MKISEVKIRKILENGPLCAIASVTFDGEFAVHDVKVIRANGKEFVVMPSRKNQDGSFRDIAHPITSEFRRELEEKVLASFAAEKEKFANSY